MTPGSEWRLLRMSLVLWMFVQLVYVTIADYPWGLYPLGQVLGCDPNWWLHECAYITALAGFFVYATFKCEEWQIRVTKQRRVTIPTRRRKK